MTDRLAQTVFVSRARGDEESEQALAVLREMLAEAGYEVDDDAALREHAQAAIVIVSPRALASETVAADVGPLAERLASDGGLRLVALPTMGLDPTALADSPLSALAGLDVPPGPSLDWRVQQVIWRLGGGEEASSKAAPHDARARSETAPDRGATFTKSGTATIGEPADDAEAAGDRDVGEHGAAVVAVAAVEHAGEPVVATGGADGTLALWRPAAGWSSVRLQAHSGAVRAVAMTTRDSALAVVSAGDDGRVVRHLDAASDPSPAPALEGHDGAVRALAISVLDGRPAIVSGGEDGTVRLWDLRDGRPLGEPLRGHRGAVRALATGALDGRPIAVSVADDYPRLWDLRAAREIGEPWREQRDATHAVAIGERAGETFVVVGGDEQVRVWGLGRGAEFAWWERVAVDAPGGALAVAVGDAEDGPVVLWGGGAGTLMTFDARAGTAREALHGHAGALHAVAALASGGRLQAISGGRDGTVRRWDLGPAGGPVGPPDERTEWISDAPALEDLLDRRALVRQLATRLERLRVEEPDRSFLIHIDGPWGSGKSTLLGFLGEELGHSWLVVRFDAWRQMRIGPPWWALLASLRRTLSADSPGRLARVRLRAAEAWQRASRLVIAMAVLMVALVAALVAAFGLQLGGFDEIAGTIAVLAGAATALFGVATATSRFWLWESPTGARVYEHAHNDPMESLADHFAWLVARAGKPVVFFVDDLDRCANEYVVELLDSIQTLIRDVASRPDARAAPAGARAAHVVVCADGRWIRNAYEQIHERSGGAVGEPGRPLGYLFLDKIFQLTVEVPAINPERQAHYLHSLLRSFEEGGGLASQLAAERDKVAERLKLSTSDSEAVAVHQQASASVRAALAGQLVDKLAEPQIERATEHRLRKFAPLLEPNPRAMKRFVNAFGLARALQIVQDSAVPSDQLALWTILRSRWPALADHLRAHPDGVDALLERRPEELPEELAALLESDDVARVVGFSHGGPLTAASIRACCGIGALADEPEPDGRALHPSDASGWP